MAWEPPTLPWGRALQPGESREAGRFTPAPQPLLSLAPRRELAQHLSVTSRKDQPQNHQWDETGWKCPNVHTHRGTHTRNRGGRAGAHTLTGTALAVTGV